MTDHTPLTDQQLDDIAARANAATDGPWGAYTFGGDTLIEIAADLEETGTGYRARRGICRLEDEPMDNDPTHRGWMAEEDWAQVQADAAYIAAMPPEVAKALVAEVRSLRAELAERTQVLVDTDAERERLAAAVPAAVETGTGPCGHDDYHGAHEWADRPGMWCPGHSTAVAAVVETGE